MAGRGLGAEQGNKSLVLNVIPIKTRGNEILQKYTRPCSNY